MRYYENIQKLNNFRKHYRKPDWNGYNALPISPRLIQKVKAVILVLPEEFQPRVFPSGRGTLQFDYGDARGPIYFEIEIDIKKSRIYSRDRSQKRGEGKIETLKTNTTNIVRRITDWFGHRQNL